VLSLLGVTMGREITVGEREALTEGEYGLLLVGQLGFVDTGGSKVLFADVWRCESIEGI